MSDDENFDWKVKNVVQADGLERMLNGLEDEGYAIHSIDRVTPSDGRASNAHVYTVIAKKRKGAVGAQGGAHSSSER